VTIPPAPHTQPPPAPHSLPLPGADRGVLGGPTGVLLRLVAVAAGIGLMILADGRFEAWRLDFFESFESDPGLWIPYVALLLGAGLAFGAAAALPAHPGGYRRAPVAAVGILPLALTGLLVVIFASPSIFADLPEWVARAAPPYGSSTLVIGAVALGFVLMSGFADRASPRVGGGRLLLRVGLMAAGLALALLSDDRLRAWRETFLREFRLSPGRWVIFLGLVMLVGVCIALAATLPGRIRGYRWARVVALASIPLVLLLLTSIVIFDPDLFARAVAQPFLRGLTPLGPGSSLTVVALLVGLAVGAGLGDPRRQDSVSPTASA
jgi:hypothetical protein